ncbi:MAG: hypothetical protein Q9202_005023 [Teloschistes flavicans]
MAIQLELPKILGIAIGGALSLLLICIVPIWLCLRRKHKALLASHNTNATRRSRAHLSITDEDVFRMPGMRRIRPSPYSHPAGWAPISSGESIGKRGGLGPNAADIDPATGVPPWPVRFPRQTKKAGPKPPVRKPSGALSPITERSTNNTATSPSLSTVAVSEVELREPTQGSTVRIVSEPSGHPEFNVSPPAYLKPKPLFHGQPRNLSHGALSSLSQEIGPRGSTLAPSEDIQLQDLRVARMPRSTSLCSQQSGQAPNFPVPPLPMELPIKKRSQQMKSPSDMSLQRVSGMSLLSGDTSVLNETMSRVFSEAGTDFTSINLASPPLAHLAPVGLGITDGGNARWNFSRVDRSASPISLSKSRPPLSQQHSLRGSIHNSLPRNQSSSLSISLLDRTFPTPEAAHKPTTKALEIPDNEIGSKVSRRPKAPRASLSGTNVFQIREDAKKAKRASTSVLNTISGNQTSPVKNPWIDRPTSIATDDPFRWDPKTSMQQPSSKPSAMKNGAKGHKRQSCVRISNIPIVIPSNSPTRGIPRLEDRQPFISPFPSPLSALFLNRRDSCSTEPGSRPVSTTLTNKNTPHPPSIQTFNPQLPKTMRSPTHTPRQSTSHSLTRPESPYSPTFSMLPLYSSPSLSTPPSPTKSQLSLSSTSSTTSTPSHRPAPAPTLAARNPNRRRAIFEDLGQWKRARK